MRYATFEPPELVGTSFGRSAVSGKDFRGVDLLAAGVPCPPYSVAGKQLGGDDERDLFPEALCIIEEARPAAIMLENVAGFASAKFFEYRTDLFRKLDKSAQRKFS